MCDHPEITQKELQPGDVVHLASHCADSEYLVVSADTSIPQDNHAVTMLATEYGGLHADDGRPIMWAGYWSPGSRLGLRLVRKSW